MSENEKLKNSVEAVVFACGEPIDAQRIAEALGVPEEKTEELLNELFDEYNSRDSGICMLRLDGRYQFASRSEYGGAVRAVLEIKKNQPLSPAAFEVLAVVAYNQPVTKSFIEQIRGVDCSGVIGTLCQRGLIEEAGRLDLPGRPLLYCTTTEFLRCFCLSSLEDLPSLPDTKDRAQALEDVSNTEDVPKGQISIL